MNNQAFAFARKVLALDALTCVAAGALMTIAAAQLAPWTGLPEGLIRVAGLSLFPAAALFGWMSRTRRLSPALINLAVVGNGAWVLGSIAVALTMGPTLFGQVFVLGQAAAVGGLAVLERRALSLSREAALAA